MERITSMQVESSMPVMTREEYGQAYEQGLQWTVRLLRARGARHDSAREIAQAAWMKGWERRSQLRQPETVINWVNTIALNLQRSAFRRRCANSDLSTTLSSRPGVNLAAIDLGLILKRCRNSDRILLEQQISGATPQEMARQQGVTVSTIHIRLFRARRAARLRLEKTDAAVAETQRNSRAA